MSELTICVKLGKKLYLDAFSIRTQMLDDHNKLYHLARLKSAKDREERTDDEGTLKYLIVVALLVNCKSSKRN